MGLPRVLPSAAPQRRGEGGGRLQEREPTNTDVFVRTFANNSHLFIELKSTDCCFREQCFRLGGPRVPWRLEPGWGGPGYPGGQNQSQISAGDGVDKSEPLCTAVGTEMVGLLWKQSGSSPNG